MSENLANPDNLMHFTLREWTRMSIAPTAAEVEHAKGQLKASVLLGLDTTAHDGHCRRYQAAARDQRPEDGAAANLECD